MQDVMVMLKESCDYVVKLVCTLKKYLVKYVGLQPIAVDVQELKLTH